MNPNALHILLVGCGKMGSAMLKSWIHDTNIAQITIIDPGPQAQDFSKHKQITVLQSADALTDTPDFAILAVKPQIMDDVCEDLKNKLDKNTVILSIAAGKTIANFESHFGADQPIIRTMPNTPAAIGKGITALCPNNRVSEEQTQTAIALLQVTGAVETVLDESLFNAITALSGSGPAYIFHMIEILEQAGKEVGLPADLSLKLARQTVIGSAALAEESTETPASTLRENVTSPGGTTAAALDILMNGELQEIYTNALIAAQKRGKELE